MAKYPYPITSKKRIEKRLSSAQFRLALVPDHLKPYQVELRLEISHLESALKNWIEGVSEYFIY